MIWIPFNRPTSSLWSLWEACGWRGTSQCSWTTSWIWWLTPKPRPLMWMPCTPASVSCSSSGPPSGDCWGRRHRSRQPRRSRKSSSNRWTLLVGRARIGLLFWDSDSCVMSGELSSNISLRWRYEEYNRIGLITFYLNKEIWVVVVARKLCNSAFIWWSRNARYSF